MPTTARLLTRPYRATTCRVVEPEQDGPDACTIVLYIIIASVLLILCVAVGSAIGVHTSAVDAAALAAAGR